MIRIFRFTLLVATAACMAACSSGGPTTLQQASAQNSVNNFANQLASSLPAGAVNDANGQPITSASAQAQQAGLIQALISQQQGHLTPAQQATLQQYLAQHTQQQPQQQGMFKQNNSVFNHNNAVFNQTPAVFNTGSVFTPPPTATTSNFHPFLGIRNFFHHVVSPTPATATTPTTPTNTSTLLPWQNGFSAF